MKPVHALLATTMIGLNLIIGFIVATLKLPIYLDSAGIILTGILAGPLLAAAVGVGTTLIGTIFVSATLWAYSGTAIVIGLVAGFLARRGFFAGGLKVTGIIRLVAAGLIIAVCAALVSAPVTAFLFGGVTASGSAALVVFFRSAGNSLLQSVVYSGFASEPVDKVAAVLLAYTIGRSLSLRTLQWFPGAAARLGRTGGQQPGE